MSEFTVLRVEDVDLLNEVIDSRESVVILFTAPSWCAPCRQLTPHFHYAAEALQDKVLFVKVDIDESPEIAERFQIQSIPQILLYRHGGFFDNIKGRTAVAIMKEIDV